MKIAAIALLVVGLALAVAPASAQEACKTSFNLVGKEDSKWYVDGAGAANPTLTACPDTAVTFTLTTEGSIAHNFVVEGSGANAPPLSASFEEGDEPVTYTWTTPASGSYKYVCKIHGAAMSGTVNVASTSGGATNGGDTNDSPGLGLVGLALAGLGAAFLLRRK